VFQHELLRLAVSIILDTGLSNFLVERQATGAMWPSISSDIYNNQNLVDPTPVLFFWVFLSVLMALFLARTVYWTLCEFRWARNAQAAAFFQA